MSVMTVERRASIALLTLNRPDSMNPLGVAGDGDEVEKICTEINADLEIRCVILTGAGRAFSAGGDVKAMQDPDGVFSGSGLKIRSHYQRNIHRIATSLYNLDVPMIAAINGPAIGLGCDVACMADIRIASDRAKFGVTFLRLGLVPGDGGSWLLPRAIGASRAAELFFTGEVIDAATAQEWGLVSRVVAHDTLLDRSLELAGRIAQLPPHSLRLTKSLLRQAATSSYESALAAAATAQVMSHATADYREGVSALLERRAATFTGK